MVVKGLVYRFSRVLLSVGVAVLMALTIWWLLPESVGAQAVHQDWQEVVRGNVLEVVAEEERAIMGTDATTVVQSLRVQLLSGEKAGEVVRFDNDLIPVAEGESVFIDRLVSIDGSEYYQLKDIERRPALLMLTAVFILLVLLFAGWRGGRALLSLVLSVVVIVGVLAPALLAGYSPALTSLALATVILAGTLFITHGVHVRSVIAFAGTTLAVAVTCLVASWSVAVMRFTGFAADSAVFLNFSTGGTLDFPGLLLGSIIIGLLGVLDDVSITQAAVVAELKAANPTFGLRDLYVRALRVGQAHVGSLVNTLALAYVGTALPLLLLFTRANSDWGLTLNQEVVAVELVRIMVGSIGLILAVPFTTLLSAWYWRERPVAATDVHEHGPHGGHTH
jgi:uncharacterized membrane protein